MMIGTNGFKLEVDVQDALEMALLGHLNETPETTRTLVMEVLKAYYLSDVLFWNPALLPRGEAQQQLVSAALIFAAKSMTCTHWAGVDSLVVWRTPMESTSPLGELRVLTGGRKNEQGSRQGVSDPWDLDMSNFKARRYDYLPDLDVNSNEEDATP